MKVKTFVSFQTVIGILVCSKSHSCSDARMACCVQPMFIRKHPFRYLIIMKINSILMDYIDRKKAHKNINTPGGMAGLAIDSLAMTF